MTHRAITASLRGLALALWIALSTGSASAQAGSADAASQRDLLERRLAAVETLLERSSAARQVETSGGGAAREKRERARALYREARAAFAAGRYARASELLPEASAQMFEAVRFAAPEEVALPKQRSDLEARLESVESLYAAFRRVAAEKPGTAGASETGRDIEALLREARLSANEGRMEAARTTLDRAYLLAKTAVSSMRSGDTLVRSLRFASREEEYRYELDRNDTHEMLVKVLLEGKARTPLQQGFLEKAAQLRTRARAAAAGSDHSNAVALLEESTRELIRAIRSAGVFIPG